MVPPIETLTFTTPRRERVDQPIPVTFCGEQFTVARPKKAVLYFAQTVAAGDVVGPDRAGAILQFLNATLRPEDRFRYFQRVIDRTDPVNLAATLELVAQLAQRWGNWPTDGPVAPVVIEPDGVPTAGAEIRVVNDELDLDVVAHPPKDAVLLFVAASLATGANAGQQAWAIGLFLDSALEAQDALLIAARMRDTDDELELEDVADVVLQLLDRWDLGGVAGNRAQRRAAARGRG